MIRTRVGYTGGSRVGPTYHALGDHSEAIEIDYDPARVSYAELLQWFWEAHNPVRPASSWQYRSAVFAHDATQLQLATESRDRRAAQMDRELYTAIVPYGAFYRAEDYHQKYALRHDDALMRAFRGYSPAQFVDSTVAARLNGYVSGDGTLAQWDTESAGFGLDAMTAERLRNRLSARR